MVLLKSLFKEQKEKKTDIDLMDIIEDVVDIERNILELKKRLKELVPKVKKNQGKEYDPNFFKDSENYLSNSKNDKYEKDTEFDHLDKRRKDDN